MNLIRIMKINRNTLAITKRLFPLKKGFTLTLPATDHLFYSWAVHFYSREL